MPGMTILSEEQVALKKANRPAADGIALLTGGFDKPYVLGLTEALAAEGERQEVIGSDHIYAPEMAALPGLTFLNLRGDKSDAGIAAKMFRVVLYYLRLMRYAAGARPRIFHVLWNNKFDFFDRTILMLYYRLLGKKIVFTAHNVNAGKRDGNDTFLNRLGLRAQYALADHVFVHTEKMRRELQTDFRVADARVSVIPFGINNTLPVTSLTTRAAKTQLGIAAGEKVLLFFGAIGSYKGLEYLADAFLGLAAKDASYRLIIAGKPKKDAESYWQNIRDRLAASALGDRVLQKIEYIPDEDTEIYCKAADVLVLPYTHVFQSGVLFLAYSFGLPVVATNVGSIGDDMVEEETGFLSRPRDAADLASAIERYFASELYSRLPETRRRIQRYANERHSWKIVGGKTSAVYAALRDKR